MNKPREPREPRNVKYRYRTPTMKNYETIWCSTLKEARLIANMKFFNYASGKSLPRGTIVERAPEEQ